MSSFTGWRWLVNLHAMKRLLLAVVVVALVVTFGTGMAAEATAEVGGRAVRLTGLLRFGGWATAYVAPGGRGQDFSPMALRVGQKKDGMELLNVAFEQGEATLLVKEEEATLRLPGKALEGVRNAEVRLRAVDMPLNQFLLVYSTMTGRSILRPNLNGEYRFTLSAEGGRRHLLEACAGELRMNGLATTNYLEKFAVLAPENSGPTKFPELPRTNEKNANQIVPAGTLSLENMPFDQYVQIYELYAGVRVVRDANLASVDFTFRAATDMTWAETVHALEVLFALNGYRLEPLEEGKVRLLR